MRSIWDASSGQLLIYYIIVLLFLLYSLYRYGKTPLFSLIIFLFFIGIFVYAGKNIQNIYRILTLLAAVYISKSALSAKTISANSFIFLIFIIYSFAFLLSSFIHQDNFTLTFSQYSRSVLMFLFYFILVRRLPNSDFQEKINKLIYYLIFLQIILSVVKFFVIGPMESIVSSLSFSGGAIATSFPLLGFVFLWMYRRGNFSNKDWLFILGLTFIGFVNYKRAIWFMMPFLIGLFMFYVQKRKVPRRMLLLIALIPVMVYLGVRLNPTLNREHKVWGSYDLNYAMNYAEEYSLGKEDVYGERKAGTGRVGAVTYLIDRIKDGNLDGADWFGRGLSMMYVEGAESEEYFLKFYGLNSIGSANGFFQSYVVFGITGAFITIVFALSFLTKIQNIRVRVAIMILFFWEYFFYTGVILREPALSFLLIYLIVYANQQFRVIPQHVTGSPKPIYSNYPGRNY